MKDHTDTICALSTPPGRSGLGVVRVSGSLAFPLAERIFQPQRAKGELPVRRAMLGRIVDPRDGSEIDEAVVTRFQAPQSYTGEDMCEYSLHGSPVLISALLECLCSLGARIADPGEFTLRAFLHGRIDLTQAEAVRDIIEATTRYQAQVAARQRSGSIAQQIKPIKAQLVDVIVSLESTVEFAEQDLPVSSRKAVIEQLDAAREKLQNWVDSFRRGRIVKDGFLMAVVGRPNVGKSSVFNALLEHERSIVTDIPGTTRDLVSEYTSIGGIPVHLQDTAGIHDSDSVVERMGIDRSLQAIADADAILLVADSSRPLSRHDVVLKGRLRGLQCFVVLNKSDLESCWSPEEKAEFSGSWPYIEVSAKTRRGIDELRMKIIDRILGPAGMQQDGVLVTNVRHCRSLEAAEEDLRRAVASLREGQSEEFALIDLHRGLQRLGEITGETGIEDLLSDIFSRFCIGK